jgi:uncharacterized protein (DUF736 family)
MEYDDKNSFILFLETDKKSEKSPDYTGTLTDESGKKWRIAAWKRVSKSGKGFLSGKVSEVTEGQGYQKAQEVYQKIKKDTPLAEVSDEPIDMSEIPF